MALVAVLILNFRVLQCTSIKELVPVAMNQSSLKVGHLSNGLKLRNILKPSVVEQL